MDLGYFALSACQNLCFVRIGLFFAKRGVAYLLVKGAMVGID